VAPDLLIALACCIPHRRPAQSPERVLPRTPQPQAQGVCWLLLLALACFAAAAAAAAGSRRDPAGSRSSVVVAAVAVNGPVGRWTAFSSLCQWGGGYRLSAYASIPCYLCVCGGGSAVPLAAVLL
jgi:hypothetical protein